MPPRLARAYRLTLYCALGCELRVGKRAPDALFAQMRCRVATLVTAWNPLSRRMSRGWNQRMQVRLRQRLGRSTIADARGSLRSWSEPMLLVPGDVRPVIRLASGFRQRGVVILRRGQKIGLRLL